MNESFLVYMLKNLNGKRYIGITSDLSNRLRQHNEGFSKYTKNKGPWVLEWNSKVMSHSEALHLEKIMKKQKGGKGLETLMLLYKKRS